MALGTTVSQATIKRFAQSNAPIFLRECDADGTALTTGDGTIWTPVGTSKGTKFKSNTSSWSETGDGGTMIAKDETVESIEISTTLHQRDEATHNLPINTADKRYLVAAGGIENGVTREAWVFGPCIIGKSWEYDFGGTGAFSGITITTIDNSASISVTLPTQIASGTITIPIHQMFAQDYI